MKAAASTIKVPGRIWLGWTLAAARIALWFRTMSGRDCPPSSEGWVGMRVRIPAAWEVFAVAALVVLLNLAGLLLVGLETSNLRSTSGVATPVEPASAVRCRAPTTRAIHDARRRSARDPRLKTHGHDRQAWAGIADVGESRETG